MNKIFVSAVIIFTSALITISLFYLNNKDEKPVKTSGALKSLQIWTDQRSYPDYDIPSKAYYNAFKSLSLNKQNLLEFETEKWRSIGPHNIGGRTNAVEINPQNPTTIYAGAASGGLWRSYTEGKGAKAWEKIETGFPVKSVGAVVINPADTNIMYIGTGEVYGYGQSFGGITVRTTRGSYGIGILKTTDGGINWSKSLDWTEDQKKGVQVLRLNPLNPNSIWAGTTEGTMRSLDGGKTWSLVHNTIMVTDLLINPLDTNKIIIACGNLGSTGNGIYRTTDYGSTWTKITANLPSSYGGKTLFSMYRTNPNLIYASIGFGASSGAGTRLSKSSNFGGTWTTVSTMDYATYQGWFSHVVGINPVDSSKVITAGIDVFKSTNGGVTLEQKSYWYNWFLGITQPGEPEGPPDYSHADHHAIAWHPTNPDIIYFGNDGGIFCSTDGGETFEGRNGGYQTQQFYPGFSASFSDSLLAMGGFQDNATAIYLGTKAWKRVIGGDGAMTAIDQSNNNILYGSWQYGNIAKSTDGGDYFDHVAPTQGEAGFIAPYVISYNNPQVLYAGRTDVFKTTDGAQTWQKINSSSFDNNPFLAMALSPLNDNVIYASTAPVNGRGNIYVSTNGGLNWINRTGNLPDRYFMDIVVDPVTESIAYVTLGGFGSPHIYRTTNYGETWSDITGNLPDVPTSAVAVDFDNPEHVYAGNDLGVFLTTDRGLTWNNYMEGLPEAVIVLDLVISPVDTSIIAATHGNGAYKRNLFSKITGVKDLITVEDFMLEQNYPNPFNPSTRISFNIPLKNAYENFELSVFNSLGEKIKTLLTGTLRPGKHEVDFYAEPGSLASGVYYYRLSSSSVSMTKKMIYLK